MRLIAGAFALACTAMAADDAHALMAKARAAYLENRSRQRYWNWTTTTTRTVLDKSGVELERLPSVTVESPIRSDGKRCNAVLAWGDGVKPYLADGDADARCTVETESRDAFREEMLLENSQVKIQSRTRESITLRIRPDSMALKSDDPLRRCSASFEGTLQLDPASFFPKALDLVLTGSACEQEVAPVNHYDDTPILNARSSLRKGSTLQRTYALQRDKNGDPAKDFWIAVHLHSVRPLRDGAVRMIVFGRPFVLQHSGKNRSIALDAVTEASELAIDSVLKFTEPK